MSKSFELMDFHQDTRNLTGKIAATYTMKMDTHSETCHPTWVFFYTKCGNIQVAETQLRQGHLPKIELRKVHSFDSARDFAQHLIKSGFSINKAWM